MTSCGHSLAVPQCSASNACTQYIFKFVDTHCKIHNSASNKYLHVYVEK